MKPAARGKRTSQAWPKHDRPRWIGLLGWAARHRERQRPFLFVSYCHADQKVIAPILAVLRNETPLWIDQRKLALGVRWSAEIVDAIRRSTGILLFCSAAAFKSNDVLREIAMAARLDKPILPLRLDDEPIPDEFLYYLSIHQLISLSGPDWREHLNDALKLLLDPDNDAQRAEAFGSPPAIETLSAREPTL